MKPDEIKLGDWARILFGQVPPSFYLELIIRAFLVYLLLMVSMRLLGKRMSTQVSRLEMVAMVSLASAIGVPMLAYDRGLLPAVIIAAIIVIMSRLIARLSFKSEHFEQVTQGDIDTLVEESVLKLDLMKRTRISRDRLFAQLRSENLSHLGAVKRLYLEANGTFTIIQNEQPKPGLMTLPGWDKDFIAEKLTTTNVTVCNNCGTEKPKQLEALNGSAKCLNCGANEWTKAVTEK